MRRSEGRFSTAPTTVTILHIYGANFGTGLPAVTLDGTPLDVQSNTGTYIIATPTAARAFPAGNYLLKVSAGLAVAQRGDYFDLTLRTQRPKGDTGPQRAQWRHRPGGAGGFGRSGGTSQHIGW